MFDNEKPTRKLQSCFNPPHQGDIVTFIQTDLETGEYISFRRVSISIAKVVLYIEVGGIMQKRKLSEGLEELNKEIRDSIENAGMTEFNVRCNGYLVSDNPLNAFNTLIVILKNRKQMARSKSASKARKRKALASAVVDMLEHAEKQGESKANRTLKSLLEPVAAELTEEEKEDMEINKMLEKRFLEKKQLVSKESFEIASVEDESDLESDLESESESDLEESEGSEKEKEKEDAVTIPHED